MAELIEIRCVCLNRHGKHPLLCKIGGENYILEVKCRLCHRTITVRWPDPLGYRKKMLQAQEVNSTTTLTSRGPAKAQPNKPAAESA